MLPWAIVTQELDIMLPIDVVEWYLIYTDNTFFIA